MLEPEEVEKFSCSEVVVLQMLIDSTPAILLTHKDLPLRLVEAKTAALMCASFSMLTMGACIHDDEYLVRDCADVARLEFHSLTEERFDALFCSSVGSHDASDEDT